MSIPSLRLITRIAVGVLLCLPSVLLAEVTAEHRKAIAEAGRSVAPAATMVRKKEFDQAETLIKAAEDRLKEIAAEAGVKEDDRAFASANAQVQKARRNLDTTRDRAEGKKPERPAAVSFLGDIAPLISNRCQNCHNAQNAQGGLRLDTFAGWRRGGKNGPIIVPGVPLRSLLVGRLMAPREQDRMPRDGEALSKEQIEKIGVWISQGARFDGPNENATLDENITAVAMANFKYPKPKGTETVSFTRDIAPFVSNLCGGCHNAQRKSGGLSLVSYFDMIKGGESGEVIVAGDKEKSRLFRLVGGLENPRMPANQSRITKKNYDDLVKWFEEGNTFDGTNPLTPLRTYVRSDDELAREKFAKMTPEERRKMRSDRTEEQWKRALPKETMNRIEDAEFLIVGNVSQARLTEVQGWAGAQLASLKKGFGRAEEPSWKGRLTIFVLKDRFGYDEFSLTIDSRQAAREVYGHSVVTANDEDAYLCLQDVGDEPSAQAPGLKASVIDHLTGAYLRRGGADIPEWLARGSGLALALQDQPNNVFLKSVTANAYSVAASVPNPDDLFSDGAFSPAMIPGIGLSVVEYLQQAGGAQRFTQMIGALREGTSFADTVKRVYNTDPATLGRQYFNANRRR